MEGEGVATIEEAIALERMRAYPLGEDILVEAYVRKN